MKEKLEAPAKGDCIVTDTAVSVTLQAERLHVHLARAGIASRRACERLILEGRVTVDGVTVTKLGTTVTVTDIVLVDGIPVRRETQKHYLALNKPAGFICSSSDPEGRPLALSLLPITIRERLYSAGRLDFSSSGLLIFTNDGEFAAKIGHPRSGIEKEYVVSASKIIPDELSERFIKGVLDDGETLKALSIKRLAPKTLSIVLVEGKNREIRRVFSQFHLHITSLARIRFGCVTLDGLPEAQSRPLTQAEIAGLQGGCANASALQTQVGAGSENGHGSVLRQVKN